ncbi:hypothetical protein HQN64_00855 [Enterobacteriaceae bacterium BIT-l23]|uniref:N-acyl amino acid synthase FeeM domain-containing protein n=1 Tax=Jejubacter sp. L23 TaxID=3092086 RepID=UPI001584C4A8|nr:hypothetical protein [Enterobacteriaceae bacterium BIT-l23]
MAKTNVSRKAINDGILNTRTIRICSIINKLPPGITIEPAREFVDFLKGMEVVYNEYVSNGIISNKKKSFLYNEGLLNPESKLFLARYLGEVVGTISIIKHHTLPCMKLFNDEINSPEFYGRSCVEVGTLSVKKSAISDGIVFKLYMKVLIYAIFVEKVDDVFIQVKEKAADFYVKNFLFEKVSAPKIHPDYQELQTTLLRADVKKVRRKIYEQKSYGPLGWIRVLCELGLLSEYKSVNDVRFMKDRYVICDKDARVYSYLCGMESGAPVAVRG